MTRKDAPPPSQDAPSIPPLPAAGPWRSYKEIVRQIADGIVEAQRPLRVLQAIRWDDAVEERFFKQKCRELPVVDASDYQTNLGYDPRAQAKAFEELARSAERDIGKDDAIGQILVQTALQYRDVVKMIEGRGTPIFYAYARKLYGSPKDRFPDGASTVRDLGHVLYDIFTRADLSEEGEDFARTISAAQCAKVLEKRLSAYFDADDVRVEVDDAILADAAAGGDYVKVRSGAKFSKRDIDVLEVHEGWVHIATSLNGAKQPVARWLAKGPPRTTAVQEGLAALLEVFTFRVFPRRARRLIDRVIAVDKAEDGADFLDVFEWFRTEGYAEKESYYATRRVFRGGVVEGGAPFTKDACYCKGIVLNFAFIRSAIQHSRLDLLPYLFAGKLAHEDVPVLASRAADGVVTTPVYLPPMFRDVNALTVWMAYSTFLSSMDTQAIGDYYAKLFARST